MIYLVYKELKSNKDDNILTVKARMKQVAIVARTPTWNKESRRYP